jgi:hypothetical protein
MRPSGRRTSWRSGVNGGSAKSIESTVGDGPQASGTSRRHVVDSRVAALPGVTGNAFEPKTDALDKLACRFSATIVAPTRRLPTCRNG